MPAWELSEGYLEAILDAGGPTVEQASRRQSVDEQEFDSENAGNTAVNYFVQQMSVCDELHLHRAWRKVAALKQQHERGSRLENMSWRIWQILRRKKMLELESAERMAKESLERDEGRMDASEDLPMSEDMTSEEGDKDSGVGQGSETLDGDLWADEKKSGVYIVMISMHGLVRGEHMELGKDSDTGGQVKYVVELARALACMPEVYRVDLLTRQICSPEVGPEYGVPVESLLPSNPLETGEAQTPQGAYIVRVPCGPVDKYLRKELLWPHVQEFADGALAHIVRMSQVLGNYMGEGKRVWPCVIHGHYADAGNVAALLSGALNVPMVMTGHSLGRNKMEQLLKQGRQTIEEINATYKIVRRVEAEERSLDAADFIVTSTHEEITNQWSHYDGYDLKIARGIYSRKKKNLGCNGRFVPSMAVIPPGLDFSNVTPDIDIGDGFSEPESPKNPEAIIPMSPRVLNSPRANPPIWSEIQRFLANPSKPMILALARPDPKKNLTTLLKAYGECKPLRELANLTLVMGNRDSIDEMASGNANIMTTVLKLIDKYDLYGQVAYPKHHTQTDVPDIYRLAARTKGVFVNPALVEPFGLTLIEAAAYGLPIVATKNGGPVDIVKTLNNGILVDPHDGKAIAEALLNLVADKQMWLECRKNGLKYIHHYKWPEHCRTYLQFVKQCLKERLKQMSKAVTDVGIFEDEVVFNLPRGSAMDALVALDEVGSCTEEDLDKILKLMRAESLTLEGGDFLKRQDSEMVDLWTVAPGKEEVQEMAVSVAKKLLRQGSVERQSVKTESSVRRNTAAAGVILGQRKRLVVFALDRYKPTGEASPSLADDIKRVVDAIQAAAPNQNVGFAVATALSVQELVKALSPKVSMKTFDVVIAGSGSKIYYPTPTGRSAMDPEGVWLCPDNDYDNHIAYRWGEGGLQSTMARLMTKVKMFSPHVSNSNNHLLAFKVVEQETAKISEDMLAYLRRRGLRGNVVYCKAATTLHVLPMHASRAQALRYLFVKWGIDVKNMVLVAGAEGDGDYAQLLRGSQSNLVLGCPSAEKTDASQRLLHTHPWLREGDCTAAPVVTEVDVEGDLSSLSSALQRLGVW